jgi:stage V sporulation protein G
VEITEVRIKLIEDGGERLHAFCSITFDDCFVIRDLKIIEGSHGPFVAMPSRKLTVHCPQCGMKNHLRSAFCNQCGTRQKDERPARDEDGRTKLYADIAHPINSSCREMIQDHVIREYQNELKRAKLPGYISHYDDIDGEALPSVSHPAVVGHVPAPHVGAPIARSSTPHGPISHAPVSHSPASHASKPSTPSAPRDQPRMQVADETHFAVHRPPASRSAASAGPRPDGFGAGIFES